MVVATDAHAVEMLGPLPVPVFVAQTVEQALNQAAATVETDALLVLSASSFPDVRAGTVAAGLVREGAGWIVGRSRTFNRDGFAPLVRERLGSRLRSSARGAGLHVWEPDATVVSTRLIRERPFEPGSPWGACLRSWAADGATGAEYEMTLAVTAEPVDSHSYWPASVLRRRRAVADLADAIATTHGRPRWLAMGLLLRELDGYPLALWLLTPWLITRTDAFPFRCSPWVLLTLWGVPALLRWVAERHAHGVRVHPLEDMLAAAFDAPGSVLALPAAVTRRVAPSRLPLPGQPLVLAGLVFAAITLVPLFTDGTTARRSTAVGLALTELALLWMLAMRAIFQRNWARSTYRIRTRLPVRVDGTAATTLDVSPTGLALEGYFHDVAVGLDVSIDISLDDGSILSARGIVADRRMRSDINVVGISLRVLPAERSRWIAQLSRSASLATSQPPQGLRTMRATTVRRGTLPARLLGRVTVALVTLVSLTAGVVLCLAVVGYRPLIVRSGSMEPALHVGDVVVVEDVEARQFAIGDIATLDDPTGRKDTLTHRVRAVTGDGRLLTVTTRGDANVADETFTMEPEAIVGRVAWRLPGIGTSVAWASSPKTRWAAGAVGGAAVGVGLIRGRRRRIENPNRKRVRTPMGKA